MRRLALVILLGACDAPALEQPEPGIYQLTETMVRDDCEPEAPARTLFWTRLDHREDHPIPGDEELRRAGASFEVGIPMRSRGLLNGLLRLEARDGKASWTWPICGATQSLEGRLVASGPVGFVLQVEEKWSETAGADDPCYYKMVVPARDCTRSARVVYELLESCGECDQTIIGWRVHCGCN